MISLRPLTINGKIVPVWLNDNTGMFQATLDGITHQHNALAGLKADLGKAKQKLNLPIYRLEFGSSAATPGVVTGIHSGTRNAMVKFGKNATEQITFIHTSSEAYFPGSIAPEDLTRVINLALTAKAAQADLETALNQFSIASLPKWVAEQTNTAGTKENPNV